MWTVLGTVPIPATPTVIHQPRKWERPLSTSAGAIAAASLAMTRKCTEDAIAKELLHLNARAISTKNASVRNR